MNYSDNPALTGQSDSPLGNWCGVKRFAAGNNYSSNVVYNNGNITKNTIGSLKQEQSFKLIPFTEEVKQAGYKLEDTEKAGVWYGPVSDGIYFWYSAFRYNFLTPLLPSILVCRKVSNCELVYAKNCNNYNMDTSNVAVNIIVRVAPAIGCNNRLYMTSSSATSIGPQLYAIEKITGKLIWSYAYYPPPPLLPTSVKKDYSVYYNSNVRLGDTCPLIINGNYILVGSSSVQNTPLNNGVKLGTYPTYKDQGNMFIIKDEGNIASIYFNWSACPPILNVGDHITTDSFLPDFNYTVIGTVSVNNPTNMYVFGSDPRVPIPPSPGFANSSPIAAIYIGGTTSFSQAIWDNVDKIYINTNRITGYKPNEVFDKLQPGNNYIWTYLDEKLIKLVSNQSENVGLYYYKKITEGIIQNQHDAQGLNYYGNNNWGPPYSFNNKIFFGTGQTHSMPFLEQYIYDNNPNSFLNKKIPVAFASNDYVSNPSSQNLVKLNDAKDDLIHTMRTVNFPKSPRGNLNYPDSIICIDFNEGFKFGIRHIPHDVYTFLTLDPNYILVGDINKPTNIADGDISSGIQIFNDIGRKKIASTTKTGLGIVIDIEDINNPIYTICQYIGPQSTLGGSNYQCTQDTKSNIYCCQPNINTLGNPFPSLGKYIERMVTRDGEYIPIGQSFLACFDINLGVVKWNTKFDGLAFSQSAGINGCILSLDLTGKLYAHDMFDGKLLWKLDNSNGVNPTHGGIAGACVLYDKIIWCPNYRIPQPLPPYPSGTSPGSNGIYGLVLSIDQNNVIINKNCLKIYLNRTFISYLPDGTIIKQIWQNNNKIVIHIGCNKYYFIFYDKYSKIISP